MENGASAQDASEMGNTKSTPKPSDAENGTSQLSGSKIKVTHRTDRSAPSQLLHHIVDTFKSQLIKLGPEYPAGSPRLDVHKSTLKTCDVHERSVEDIYIYDITPKHSPSQNGDVQQPVKKRRIYYFAGGGWQMPPSGEHWKFCTEFAKNLPDTTISLVSYPLAPNSPAPISFPQTMKMYRHVLQDAEEAGEKVILAGDSAGGNFVLCLSLAALSEDEFEPAPTAVMAISPSCDLRRSNPAIQEIKKHDPILREPFIKETARKWHAEWDPADPRVSPLFADVMPLARRGVKVHGVTGGYDMLSADAILFREKCEQAGVEGEWLQWDKQMHCFPLAWPYHLPESVEAKNWVVDVMRRS
jgi:acetyl esterase/lipase